MKGRLLLGLGRAMIPLPRWIWQRQISQAAQGTKAGMGFMSAEHRRVHHHVVRELPRVGETLAPEHIASTLKLPLDRVNAILDDLEKHKTFLFRNKDGAVLWAYPVTADRTPHRVAFSSGEQIHAA